jgi:hypothetical protein
MNVILVGLDGLEPSLVERWADDLPTLRRLMNEGSFGRVRSADPPLSSPAWPWIFTGKQGGKHGCFGFTKRRDGEYSWEPVNYGDINAESLWEALDDAGVSCGAANVPLTYPPADLRAVDHPAPVPEDVDGEVPADRLAYEPDPAIRGSHDDEARSRDYTEAESEDVREQLKGLGYLE